MSKLININFGKRRIPTSILGLALDGSRLEGVVLRRSNGSLHVNQRFAVDLTLDPLSADVELVGREILNHLQSAGVRERACVVALPLKWALAAHVQIPKLPDSDIPGFLAIEAERGFPTDVATLQMVTSRLSSPTGEQHATFVGIPRNHVERLEQVLRAAKLKPVSFSLGITALQAGKVGDTTGVLALVVGEHHVGLQVTFGGGVAALRALEGAMQAEGGERQLPGELIAREARITMGQLPADLRDAVRVIRIFGPRDYIERLATEIRPRFETGGVKVELVSTYPPAEFGRDIPANTPVSSAFSLAARQLAGRTDPFEFLPPKVSTWQRVGSKYAPGKLRKVAAVAALALLVVAGLFVYQEWQLRHLRNQWAAMSEVDELEQITAQIGKYRPWFDRSFKALTTLQNLTAAFPDNGAVTAKMLEIRDMNTVTCSGNAENYAALLRTVSLLGTNGGVYEMSVQTRGKAPMQFTLSYQLTPPASE